MKSPLLSICIPTWNRCKYLKKNLDILLPQVMRYKDEVSVYVSDNASDDDTPKVIKHAEGVYPQIVKSFRQKTNIGSAGNFVDSISKIDSEYFLLLGDDDYVMPFYLDYIVRILKENSQIDWLCYNGTRFTENNEYLSPLTTLRVDGHEKYYQRGEEMVKDLLDSASLMSQNVYRRELFLDGMIAVSPDDYPGYSWYATMCLQIIDRPCYYCDITLIEQCCHSGSPWQHNNPWYRIYSLGRLFHTMNTYCDGTYSAWMQTLNNQKEIRSILLSIINQNRSLYKTRIKTMQQYACSKLYATQMKIYSTYPYKLAIMIDKALRAYALLDKRMKAVL